MDQKTLESFTDKLGIQIAANTMVSIGLSTVLFKILLEKGIVSHGEIESKLFAAHKDMGSEESKARFAQVIELLINKSPN